MPEWKEQIRQRIASLGLTPTREGEIAEELAQHLDDRYEELLSTGMVEEQASRVVLAELSNTNALIEELRLVEPRVSEGIAVGAGTGTSLRGLWQDLRYCSRMWLKQPGFTLVVAITLALGIGANTAVFSLIDAFLFKVLPVKDPEQLVFVQATLPKGRTTVSFPFTTFEELRRHNHSFSGLFAWDDTPVSVTLDDQPELVAGDFVSGNYFDVLGVGAVQGRTFSAADDQPGKSAVAVISYNYSNRRFGEARLAVGKTIYVGRIPLTVIGVTAPDFFGREVAGRSADVVIPMSRPLPLRAVASQEALTELISKSFIQGQEFNIPIRAMDWRFNDACNG